MPRTLLTTGQAAKLCSVTPDTVLKWIKSGRLEASQTAGGHYRVDPRNLEKLAFGRVTQERQFCWEFHAGGNIAENGCRECIVFKARAQRCYELADLEGHTHRFCPGDCETCEYHRKVWGQAPNVLVVTESEPQTVRLRREALDSTFNLRITDSEYGLASSVDDFRPDFVVLDGSFAVDRVQSITENLLNDPRVRLVRILVAARPHEFRKCCGQQIFARIPRPFGVDDIARCIKAARDSA